MQIVKFTTHCHKYFSRLVASVFILPCLVLSASAQSTGDSFTVDTSVASTAVTEMKTKIVTFITSDMVQAILAVVGAGIVIWLLFLAWKLIKRGGSKAG